jgi:hypothetical protein
MGAGASGHRHITPRYEAVIGQLNATHDLNKKLKDNGYSPASGLYDANNKAKAHKLINTPEYKHYDKVNKKANKSKHQW